MSLTIATTLVRLFLAATALAVVVLPPTDAYAICGDGNFEDGEECDDGNNLDGDCCDKDCQFDPAESACDDDGNQCTGDFCNGEGTCIHFIFQGAECDDGNSCTIGETCNSDGICSFDIVEEDQTPCSDDALCGSKGLCFSGQCLGDPADCSVFNSACNVSNCNVDNGLCETTQREDGTVCDNPSTCTDPGQCENGECIQPPTDCSDFADACHDAFCDVEANGCYAVQKEDGTPCDDTNGCTDAGNCKAGTCETSPKDCSSFADQCNDAGCDQKSEEGCFSTPKAGNPACNDGNLCTTGDTCGLGECTGAPVDCSAFEDDCNSAFCNPQTGQCGTLAADNGTPCDDGDPCTTGEQCDDGECVGDPVDCSASADACNFGICNGDTGQCEKQPNPQALTCSDDNLCTTGDQCDDGACVGTPTDCSGQDGACTIGVCNGDTGGCEADPVEDSTGCSDGNLCTTGDQCTRGLCLGDAVDCSAENGSCIVGTCNPDTGQCIGDPVEDGSPCSDGDNCTQSDECSGGTCVGDPITCKPPLDPCQQSSCDAGSGECVLADAETGTPCDDGDACTTDDECTTGQCGGTPVDCSDLTDDCNTGVCTGQGGECVATPKPNDTPCNDGAFCTATDTCAAGVCTGTGDPCAGGAECADTCNEGADTCNEASGTACTDDGNPCTEDTCDGQGTCGSGNVEGPCDDGLFCTTNDRCEGGLCVGDPTCPPTEACGDTCNEEEDACRICGKPFSNERCVVNAVFVLQGALDLRECELCTCDVDSSGTVTATDALMVLRTCAKLPTQLECPEPTASTTTTTFAP
ncbi:MAG: hypothetical protein ABR538_01760 [Candidatus Binatia bacterium]